MPPGQLQDGVDGRRAHQVDVELGLGQGGDEIEHMTMLPERANKNATLDRVMVRGDITVSEFGWESVYCRINR
jgi:hypothetical protein